MHSYNPERPHITVIGGGTGTSNLVDQLKYLTPNLSTIVNTSDNDGSSGQLVRQYGNGLMPMGDGRQCLAAQSPYALVAEGYNLRDENGHPKGNLSIVDSYFLTGDFAAAFKREGRLLNIIGEVIPVTTTPHDLLMRDGVLELRGESSITNHQFIDSKAAGIYHDPRVDAHIDAIDAIFKSDALVIAPGNIFSSLLPALTVNGIPEAIAASTAEFVVATNLVNRKGQNNNWHVMDYIDIIQRHVGSKVDTVIYNNEDIAPSVTRQHHISEQDQVRINPEAFDKTIRSIGAPLVSNFMRIVQPEDKLLSHARNEIVHDARGIAHIVFEVAEAARLNRTDEMYS